MLCINLLDPLISSMTCQELLQFRQCSGAMYGYISIDIIKRKVLQLAKDRLMIMFGDKYDGLVDILKKWDVRIFGPWVTQLFYDEDWDVGIQLKYWISNNSASNIVWGTYVNNIINRFIIANGSGIIDDFIALEKQSMPSNGDSSYSRANGYNYFDYAIRHISINGNKIMLYVFGKKEKNYHKVKSSKIFRNCISIWDVEIYDVCRIVNRMELVNLCKCKNIGDVVDYYNSFGIKMGPKKISKCVSYCFFEDENEMDPLVLYGSDRMLLFDHCVKNIIGCDESIESCCGNIRIKGYNDSCTNNCRYNYFGIDHFHQQIFLKRNDGIIIYANATFMEYNSVMVADVLKDKYELEILDNSICFGNFGLYEYIWRYDGKLCLQDTY